MAIGILLTAAVSLASSDDVEQQLQQIARTGPGGTGQNQARIARDRLIGHGPEILPRLARAMDTTNVVAANWYRTIYDAIAKKELAKSLPQLPVDELKKFVRDTRRQGKARRLVLETVDRIEPDFGKELIPTLLDDPEFRNDAVNRVLESGDAASSAGNDERARELYRRAFRHARAASQVVTAAERLKSAGEPADIIAHLGFVIDWIMVGPFDAPEYSGFGKVFPPEEEIELKAEYTGQGGEKIRWKRHTTTDSMGTVNLIDAVASTREAVAYAYTEIDSPTDQAGQLRAGADDNVTVWLNGEKVLAREQWLNGTRLDRFVVDIRLQKGTNRLLAKVCQGPQHVDPQVSNNWTMQIRLCDREGAGLEFKSALPEPGRANAP